MGGDLLSYYDGVSEEFSVTLDFDTMRFLALMAILRITESQDRERQVEAESEGTPFHPELPSTAQWSVVRSLQPQDLARHLAEAVYPKLLDCPPDSPLRLIPHLLPAADLKPESIKNFLTLFTRGPLAEDNAFEPDGALLKLERRLPLFLNFSRGWRGVGEFVTPPAVADLMIDLAAPRLGDRVYNPCVGLGTLLVRTATRAILPALGHESPGFARNLKANSFYGLEINPGTCLVALAQLMLAGITRPHLELGDVLERPLPDSSSGGTFDVILCNTPIGLGATPEQSARFPIRSRSIETLIFQHVLAHLRPRGRAVMLMPEAFLYRPGPEELLRKRIVQDFRLELVVPLPGGTVHGLGELRTCLLVVHRLERIDSVAFVTGKAAQSLFWGSSDSGRMNENVAQLLGELRGAPPTTGQAPASDQAPTATVSESTPALINREKVEDIASHRWELIPKYTGVDQLQVLLDSVQRTGKQAAISTLRYASCTVWSGMSYYRYELFDGKPDAASDATEDVRLVRVRDLLANRSTTDLNLAFSPHMSRLTPQGIARAPRHCFLREGDKRVVWGAL